MNTASLRTQLVLSLACCLLTLNLFGQSVQRTWDVYLNDGNFLRVSQIDTLADGQLRVQSTSSKDAMLLPPSLVKRIRLSPRGSLLGQGGRSAQAEGWYLEGATMLLAAETAGFDEGLRTSLSFQFGAGYYYRPWLALGAGLGIDWYEEAIIPVFLQARAYLPQRTNAPYLQLQAGYGIPAHEVFQRDEFERTHGGLFWHPAIGIRLASKRRIDYHLDLGYRFQGLRYEFNAPENEGWWWPLAETREMNYRSFVIRLSGVF